MRQASGTATRLGTLVADEDAISILRALLPARAMTWSEAHSIAERQAAQLLDLLNIAEPPVPQFVISSLPGIVVDWQEDWPISGTAVRTRSHWRIVLKTSEPRQRQRFSLAHEFKHVLDDPVIDRTHAHLKPHRRQERAERLCNYFAACLLMPRPWIKHDYCIERVQAVLDAHRAGGERSKKHSHYLNGSLFCRVCGARLGYGNHRAKLGGYYEYYSCLSRVRPAGPCGNPYATVARVEEVVSELHDQPWLNAEEQTALRTAVREFVTAKAATAEAEAERHGRRLRELTAQQQKLVQLYYRDAISVEVMQAEQQRIAAEQAQVERWQSQAVAQVDDVVQALDDALTLLCKPGKAYEQADASLRKLLNRAIFSQILIQVVDRRIEVEGLPHEVFTALVQTAKSLGMAPDRPPDILVEAHQAVLAGPPRTTQRRSSTNKPQPVLQGSGFARRQDGGEGGIRTRDGG